MNLVDLTTYRLFFCYKTQFQKFTVDLSRKFALFVIKKMKDLDFMTQHDVLEKFISHPLLNSMFFDHLVDLQFVKGNHEVLSNMKARITEHLMGQKKSD